MKHTVSVRKCTGKQYEWRCACGERGRHRQRKIAKARAVRHRLYIGVLGRIR